MLPPVVVTASRIAQPQADAIPGTTVITSEIIRRKQSPDLVSILRNEAGVQFAQSGPQGSATSLFLRGANTNQFLFLLDGVPVRDMTSTGIPLDLQNITPDQVERIEIVRGNVSAIYGSGAIGGVIQVFTRQGEGTPSVSASGEVGTHRSSKLNANVSGKVDATRFSLSASRTRTDGFSAINPSKNPNANPDNDGYRDVSVSGALSHEYIKGHEAGIRLYGFDAKYDYDSGSDRTEKAGGISKQRTLALFSKNRFTGNWLSTLTFSNTEVRRKLHSRGNTLSFNDYRSGYRSEANLLQWHNEVALPENWILTMGTDGTHEKAVGRDQGVVQSSASRNNESVYAGLNGSLGAHHLQVNARYDHVEESGSDTTGYLGYAYDITPSWKLVASASTAFLAPTLYQVHGDAWTQPNKGLSAERSHSYEAGFQYASGATLARLVYFDTRTRDMIDYVYNMMTYTGQYFNINRAKNKGVELTASTRLFGVDVRGSATWQDPKDRETGEALLRRAKQAASLDVSRKMGAWLLGGDVYYARHRPDLVSGQRRELASYALLNLNVRYEINKMWFLFARVENVFDREYETVYSYNQPDRRLFVGVNWKM